VSVRAIHGDCLDVLPTLGPVDAIVTDPPYHLGPQKTQEIGWPSWTANTKNARREVKAGFMGQTWDGGDIAFRPETWATIGAALKPGGFMLAFGAPRTYHRMACAIEDGGFIIQDCIMWIFGQGFPKNKMLLKPAFEPILLCYKPGDKRALNIDECRIGAESTKTKHRAAVGYWTEIGVTKALGDQYETGSDAGRWPANLCHDGSDEVLALFPQSAPSPKGLITQGGDHFSIGSSKKTRGTKFQGHGDSGSAARFFFSAKAGAEDRWGSRHPTVKPVALIKWLVQLVTPLRGLVLDPFAGSGTTGVAALATGRNAILIEREHNWFADIQERIAFYEGEGRHSLQVKARRIATPRGEMPLFEVPA